MKVFTLFTKPYFRFVLLVFMLLQASNALGQSYWTGATSSDWNTASNWSPVGIPGATTSVIIGGSNFTGANQPVIDEGAIVNVGSITLQGTNTAGAAAFLYVSNDFNVVVAGNIEVGAGTILENNGADIIIQGDFLNNGSVVESVFIKNNGRKGRFYPSWEMSGVNKKIGGTTAVIFSHLKISGSIYLDQHLNIQTMNMTVTGQQTSPSSDLTVTASGTFDPKTYKVTFNGKGTVASDGTNGLVVEGGGTLKVMAATYSANYTIQPTTLYTTSTIDYAALTGTQTVLARLYGILKISGGGIKELEGNTTVSDVAATTQLLIEAGTLDLKTFTVNRTGATTPVVGGTLTVANGATLRIGGTNTFPTGYQTRNFGSTSTVEYYGQNQVVTNELYGNLHLSSTAASIKTMPSAAMSISGDLKGSGFASFTALGNITANGNVLLSDNASFNGGTGFTHTIGGNWTNNANFTGNTSTILLNGTSKTISRTVATSTSLKNEFHNLTIAGSGTSISVPSGSTLTINGNLTTTGAGTLTQSAESLTLAGTTAGAISGAGIILNDFIVDGTNKTSTASFSLTGNFTTNATKSFTATAGTITMAGANKTITATGATTFFGLNISGATNTATSFAINSDLSGNYLTATNGTITFGGATATIAGIHNLNNISITGTDRRMGANANLGLKGTLAVTGLLDVTTNIPNTITYDGTSAQTVLGRAYNNIVFSNGGTKTAGTPGLTVNGDLTISSGSNFNGSGFNHNLNGNWINNGTFVPSTSTVSFRGATDAVISGSSITTFNNLTLNKAASTNNITLNTSAITATLTMTTGVMYTSGNNSITVTNTKSGNGWIIGTITRTHTFNSNAYYYFAGPYNGINFTNGAGVITSVTVKNTSEAAANFTEGSTINRQYSVNVSSTGSYVGTIMLQYEDTDLNGNTEANLKTYQDAASNGSWVDLGVSGNSMVNNWVAKSGVSNLNGTWTLSAAAGLRKWTGAGVNRNWETPENWSDNTVPTNLDIAILGELGSGTINQPLINGNATVSAIQFKGNNAIMLDMANGSSLTVFGNVSTSGNAASGVIQHNINTGAATITVNGNLILSGGSSDHSIDLNIGSGNLIVLGNLNQNTGSDIVFSDNGNLKIKGNYNKTAGSFTSSNTGTITYDGTSAQVIAAVPYHNLNISKASGIATLSSTETVTELTLTGDLTVTGSGTSSINLTTLNVNGNVNVSGGILNAGASALSVKGNWSVGGTFVPGTSIVKFTGNNSQTVTASTFNNLTISKSTGTLLTALGNTVVNSDLLIESGILDLGLNTMNRSAVGGTFTLANEATLQLGGSNNFPSNFNTNTLGSTSIVHYNGAIAQTVAPVTYGLLTFSNGSTNKKLLTASTKVINDLTVNSGASFDANSQTLTISGNFTNNGSFSPGAYADITTAPTGTLVLASTGGASKTISGNLTVNNFVIQPAANYTLASNLTINGSIDIVGTGYVYVNPYVANPVPDVANNGILNATSATVSVAGDFKNSGILKSSGFATFLGVRHQNIQLLAPILPGDTGSPTVVFDGTVSPTLNSTRSPQFATVSIKNTGGITTSVGWTVGGQFTVYPGASFHGGPYTHTFYTTFVNQGTFTSSGLINFIPPYPGVVLSGHPFYFGTDASKFQSTGTLRLGGTKQILVSGVVPAALNNLVIANTVGISTTTLSSSYPLTGTDWNLTGSLTIEGNGKLNGIPGTNFTIAGNLINNGSIISNNPSTGAAFGSGANFTFNGTSAEISGIGSSILGNITFGNNSNVIIGKDLNIYGNITHNGSSLNTPSININLVGAAPATISGTAGNLSLENIKIDKPSSTVTLGANIIDVSNLTLTNGTLDVDTYKITKPVTDETTGRISTSTLTMSNGTILKVRGANNFPALDNYSLGESSTVVYNGATQSIASVQYGNLSLLNTATATFDSGTALIAGNLVIGGETTQIIITPDTINYNGSGAQTVAAINYKNLTLSNAATKTFAVGTVGVSGSLTKADAAEVDANNTGVTVNYNGVDSQNVLPTAYYNLSLSNTGVKSFSGVTGVEKDLIANSPAIADLTTNSSTVNFNGATTQALAGLNYHSIQVSGGGDKSLTGSINVAKDIIMTSGKLLTGSNKITLSSTGNVVGEGNTNYITGTLETTRNVTTSGTSGASINGTQSTTPLGVAAVAETFGNIGLTMAPVAGEPGTVKVTRVTGAGAAVGNGKNVSRYFQIEPSIASSSNRVDITMSYLDHELKPEMTGDAQKDLLFYWSDTNAPTSSWRIIETSDASSAVSTKQVKASNVGQSGYFTLGSRVTPLPVELLSFTAKKNGNNAELKWATASEQNNAGFEVQVSTDGYTYQRIGYVESKAGSSSVKQEYSFTDVRNGKYGMQYYRLKQIDLDGSSKLYGPKTVDFGVIAKATTSQAYPNPFNDNLRVSLNAPKAGIATIKLYTSAGKLLKTLPLQVQAGLNDSPLPVVQAAYEPGLYLLVIELNGQQQIIKLMKE